jgi:hypothetical protein
LKERLERELIDRMVFIEESWDLSEETFNQLIADAPSLAKSLCVGETLSFGSLRIRSEEPRHVHVSGVRLDPYELAEQNSKYAIRSAHQFTRNSPFVLIFVLHPWFDQGLRHHDFAATTSTFTRALARRTFMQFTNDGNLVSEVCDKVAGGITFAEATQLLSGLIFLNVWPDELYPQGTPERKRGPSYVYLNPRAAHPISRGEARIFAHLNPHIGIEDFVHDNY